MNNTTKENSQQAQAQSMSDSSSIGQEESDGVVENASFLRRVRTSIMGIVNVFFPRTVLKVMLIYFTWITVHYLAAYLYIHFCAHLSWTGYIMSAILVPAPHCEGLRWIIYNGAIKIQGMWILLGGYILHFVEYLVSV
jgi:hypothetical protein